MITADLLDGLDHRLLVEWACDCAERALPLFEADRPGDDRPRLALDAARAWAACPCTHHLSQAAPAVAAAYSATAQTSAAHAAFAAAYTDPNIDPAVAADARTAAANAACDASELAGGDRPKEEEWQARHLLELIAPELTEAQLGVGGALLVGDWTGTLEDLRAVLPVLAPAD